MGVVVRELIALLVTLSVVFRSSLVLAQNAI